MSFFSILLQPFTAFLSSDPAVAATQAGLLILAVFVLFLLFYTLRDVVLRSRSFVFQCLCILVVALLPGVGFLLYLLIRPARTIKEREIETMVRSLTEGFFGGDDEEMDFEEREEEQPKPSQNHRVASKEHHRDHTSQKHPASEVSPNDASAL